MASSRHSLSAASRWSGPLQSAPDQPLTHEARTGVGQHKMRVAFPSRKVAKRLGLNRNHHLRVWCDCMDLGNVGLWGDKNDPRRLGNYDALGIVDTREPKSAQNLYRKHLESQ